MIVKICGMRDSENIKNLMLENIHLMGFIFYPESKRYAEGLLDRVLLNNFPGKIKKTGVFVNEPIDKILEIKEKYQLDFIQLHGDESPAYCEILKEKKINLIKAFGIESNNDLLKTKNYDDYCDFYIFDTKTDSYGGSGRKFNWQLLDEYKGNKPFLLSGGIKTGDEFEIINFTHPKFAGIDINSGFEDKPGLKNIKKIQDFIEKISKI